MTRPLTTAIAAALLALAAGLTLAQPDGQATLSCAEGMTVSSSAADFDDGPRLPLVAVGVKAGVIVVVRDRNINIIRRDGTELRLKGVLPSDPPAAGDSRKPIIRDGEVWVRQEDLPALLARPCSCDSPRHYLRDTSVAQLGGFDTFEVPSPTISRPAPPPKPAWPPPKLPALQLKRAEEQGWLQVSPVEIDIGLSRIAGLTSPGVRGTCQDIMGPAFPSPRNRSRELQPHLPVSRLLSYLSMEVGEGHRRYSLGDSYHPLFGWSTGLGFASEVSPRTELGASLVVPNDLPGQNPDGQVMFRARTRTQNALAVEAEIAGDGGYHAAARWKRPGLSLQSSVLDRADGWRQDTWWQKDVSPGLALVGRTSAARGDYEAQCQALGLRSRIGQLHLSAERNRTLMLSQETISSSLSVSLIRRDLFGVLRYATDRAQDTRSGLDWTITRLGNSGRQVSLSSAHGQDGAGRSYRLGAFWPVGRDLRARVSMEWSPAGTYPEGKIEWRPSTDQMVALRYGPFYSQFPGDTPERIVALHASFAFGGTGGARRGTGRITGRVKDDAGHGVADVGLMLDAGEVTFTQADGSYEFSGVEEGIHAVRIDPNHLHADLGTDRRARTVVVTAKETAQADFLVTRLCRISGQVSVETVPAAKGSGSGQSNREPLAGVVVLCEPRTPPFGPASIEPSDRLTRATTDERGSYVFGSLPPGRYTISLGEQQSVAGLILVPPSVWTFALQAGEQVTGANFVFQRHERPVVFDVVTTAE